MGQSRRRVRPRPVCRGSSVAAMDQSHRRRVQHRLACRRLQFQWHHRRRPRSATTAIVLVSAVLRWVALADVCSVGSCAVGLLKCRHRHHFQPATGAFSLDRAWLWWVNPVGACSIVSRAVGFSSNGGITAASGPPLPAITLGRVVLRWGVLVGACRTSSRAVGLSSAAIAAPSDPPPAPSRWRERCCMGQSRRRVQLRSRAAVSPSVAPSPPLPIRSAFAGPRRRCDRRARARAARCLPPRERRAARASCSAGPAGDAGLA